MISISLSQVTAPVIIAAVALAAVATGVVFETTTIEARRPHENLSESGGEVNRAGPRPSLRSVANLAGTALANIAQPRPIDDESVAVWAESLARELRGGASMIAALDRVEAEPTLARRLEPLQLALQRGAPLRAATERVTTAGDGLGRALAVIRVSSTAGTGAAIGLDRTAATLRERCAIAAERKAQSAQARLSAQVLTVLPGCAVVVMASASPTLRATLMGPVGMVCLPIGAGLNLTGWLWMRRILRVRP